MPRMFNPATGQTVFALDEDVQSHVRRGWQRVADGTHGSDTPPDVDDTGDEDDTGEPEAS